MRFTGNKFQHRQAVPWQKRESRGLHVKKRHVQASISEGTQLYPMRSSTTRDQRIAGPCM
jgi:hypothetical protein